MAFNSETAAKAGAKGGAISRRTKDPDTVRTKTLAVKISPEEFDMITLKAGWAGLSKADFIVKLVEEYESGTYAELLHKTTAHLRKDSK